MSLHCFLHHTAWSPFGSWGGWGWFRKSSFQHTGSQPLGEKGRRRNGCSQTLDILELKTTVLEFLSWLSGLGTGLVIMRMPVWSLALLSGLWIRRCHSHGVGRRLGSDPTWLWLWRRPAATSLFWPLAWEPPSAAGMALKRKNEQKLPLFCNLHGM